MLISVFTIFSCSIIPDQFLDLAQKAILNSTIKVPKSLREDTKYPGNYTFGKAHFTLYKILTSSQTTDIKGYAIENNYAAIVKRKKFKLLDGFTLLDIQNQEFYLMEEIAASDDKINIYKVRQIDMFCVFSDIEIKGKTPLYSFSKGLNWDQSRDRPKLTQFGILSAGAGAYFSASFHAKIHFKSIKKAEITVDVSFVGKVGVELQMKKTAFIQFPDFTILDDIDVPIPGWSISFRFLGLKFEFGLFVTFGAVIKDIIMSLQVDIDYFKGYQFTANRYISIKIHGISDSGWQTDFSSIPSGNLVDGIVSSLEENKISATIELKQGIKLKATIFSMITTDLQFGLVEPFSIEFGFSPLSCPFPYLYGQIELPLHSYFSFSGIILKIKLFGKKKKYKLLKPKYKDKFLFHLIKTKKYCLFDSKSNNDYTISDIDGGEFDDGDDQFINETSDKIITLEIMDLQNRKLTKSLLSLQVSLCEFNSTTNTQVQLFSRRTSPFEDITSKKSEFNTVIAALGQNRVTSRVSSSFWYYIGTNLIEQSNENTFFLKEYLRNDNSFVPFIISNSKKTEEISFNLRLKYCENITINEMYVPKLSNGLIDGDLQFGDKLCAIVKDIDTNDTDYFDEGATFITDGTLANSLCEHGVFTYEDEFFMIELASVKLPFQPDSGIWVNYEIRAEWGENYQEKTLLINGFSDSFTSGLNFIKENYKVKFRLTSKMRLYFFVSYINNYNIISLKQSVAFSEVLNTVNSETQMLVKTQPDNMISCTCGIERYKPIVIVNCSQENSTHRIITNVFTLNSVKPSEYKPQEFKFQNEILYGVFQLKKIDKNIKWVIIHMPQLQPLCNFTMISDEYYQIKFDKDIINIPFRRENSTDNEITIKHVIQGNFVDEETIYFSNKYYSIDFSQTPVAIILVRTINDQYSVIGIDKTKKTLINYGDDSFQMLVLEYYRDQIIIIASSLIIIDDQHPLVEKTIPDFPILESVTYHVWCERADEILVHDKTSGITIEHNTLKEGQLFIITVIPSHMIDFVPVCNNNFSQSLCYFKQTFNYNEGYAVFRYPNKNGITILDTNLPDLFEQEDRQGLIEEVIDRNKSFYYMTSFNDKIRIIRTYKTKLDLELRIIEVKDKYRKFCIYDPDGYIVPISRSYYTDDYIYFMDEFGIQSDDEQYYDFKSGDDDSCIYATYTSSDDDVNGTDLNDTGYVDVDDRYSVRQLLSDYSIPLPNPSLKICDIAKSLKVSYLRDIRELVPPAKFDYVSITTNKLFEEDLVNNLKFFNYEVREYFIKVKMRTEDDVNNSIFLLKLPYKEITYNLTLDNDEYISADGDFMINYQGGVLNYILTENSNTIIDLGYLDEIELNLIGKGNSLEFKTKDQSKIKIKGTFNIDSNISIKVNDDVKFVEIENVNCANYTEFYGVNTNNEKIYLRIKNLTLLEHSKANLTYTEIYETIFIKQTATAIFDYTVIINNADLTIEMIAYQNDLIPMLSGVLPEPPKTIKIQRNIEKGPKNKEEYIIFDGEFDCQTWVDKIDFGNSFFNTARCTNNNNTETQLLSSSEQRAFISFIRKTTRIIKETYWPGGLIAVVFFGVVDFILLVLVVIFQICCCCCGSYYAIENAPEDDISP